MSAGLDYWKWRNDEYPPWFRAEVVAWYELDGLVKMHAEDAARAASEKASKKDKK